jgi:hypothetical protein
LSVDHRAADTEGHVFTHPRLLAHSQRCRSRILRPPWSRDITVPTGQSSPRPARDSSAPPYRAAKAEAGTIR